MTHLLTTLSTSLTECDELLREIRAENLDGSEPAVGEALERASLARKAAADAFPAPETLQAPVRVLVDVRNPNDLDASPSYATILVDNQFIAHLRHLQGVCKALDLDTVLVNGSPEAWHYEDDNEGEGYRTELDYLSVGKDIFSFTAEPKHQELPFESETFVISDFLNQALACQDEYLILADGVELEYVHEIVGGEPRSSARP